MVYMIINYDGSGTEHNYLFSRGMGKNHYGICFLKVEERVYGADTGTRIYMDVKNYNYYNQYQQYKWNVVCVMYDQTGKANASSLWVNRGNVCNFTCKLPANSSTLNLFNRVVHFDMASSFNGNIERDSYYKPIPSGLITARMTH